MASDSNALDSDVLRDLHLVEVMSKSDTQANCLMHNHKNPEERGVLLLIWDIERRTDVLASSVLNSLREVIPTFRNDRFYKYELHCDPLLSSVRATLIFPATDKDIKKYSKAREKAFIRETKDLYDKVTLPYIQSIKPSDKQWVYNVLDGTAESENVIYRDPCQENGFTLVRNLTWNIDITHTFYYQALVNRRDIRSIRDLRCCHLPMLKSIRNNALRAISERHDVSPNCVLAFFHYHPTFWHLHVHFVHRSFPTLFEAATANRAILLDDVIDNLEADDLYYDKRSITFTINEDSPLLQQYATAANMS